MEPVIKDKNFIVETNIKREGLKYYDIEECDDDCCDCDDEVYEIECPVCNDIIYLDGEMLEEEGMVCPNCGTELEFDFDGCDCCECEEAETEE